MVQSMASGGTLHVRFTWIFKFRNKHVLFWLTLILFSTLSFPLFSQFAGGSGTEQDPWKIATAKHLNNVRNYLDEEHSDKHFIQIADIDLDVAPYNTGEGWEPIGSDTSISTRFYGTYDGDEHVVTGLYINRPESDYQGLFGYAQGTIKNLGVKNINITSHWYIGGLVGVNIYGSIYNCYSTGSVTGGEGSGGLVGMNYSGSITNCYGTGSVTGDDYVGCLVGGNTGSITNCYGTGSVTGIDYVGGLVGGNVGSIISCYGNGSVTGDDYVGGLVGDNDDGSIISCYSTGSVTGNEGVGGLVGVNTGSIKNSYSTGSVTGDEFVGGLVGWNDEGSIINCYSTGSVTGDDYVGGLVGDNDDGSINSCYWDINRSGQEHSDDGEGRNTEEMVYPHSEDTYLDWDWQIWTPDLTHEINDGYPYLRRPD
ncbi:MAG: hypothetical protein GX294_06560 [Candidatus Cloacimonetes bacterium]|nr:hypothetical protein [Candidatus Cloacimonadota bacterium]